MALAAQNRLGLLEDQLALAGDVGLLFLGCSVAVAQLVHALERDAVVGVLAAAGCEVGRVAAAAAGGGRHAAAAALAQRAAQLVLNSCGSERRHIGGISCTLGRSGLFPAPGLPLNSERGGAGRIAATARGGRLQLR